LFWEREATAIPSQHSSHGQNPFSEDQMPGAKVMDADGKASG
jgi:hypothetical protein